MRKYLYGIIAFVLAFAILSVSVLKSSTVAYGYTPATPSPSINPSPTPMPEITYLMPYPGPILPDSLLWYFKAARDRIQYLVTIDPLKKADLALLYSDKRLEASVILFKDQKPSLAATTLEKGEKYLEMAAQDEKLARKGGENTNDFLVKLADARLNIDK